MGNRNKKKPVERLKSRKELRKDKRLQKKANRVHFQKRKKELKIEYKERLKQKNLGKKGKLNGKQPAKEQKYDKTSEEDEEDFMDGEQFVNGDDEEIESDFELSDEELEMKTKSMSKSKPAPKPAATQMELDHQRLLKQEQSLRKDMGKKRIKQLKMANEEEDKTIHKLEKLLKIDKSRSKKIGVPKMFHDGLDYALEMCLPENIEKMYAAAKEAADADQQSDSEWQEDFAIATGEIDATQSTGESTHVDKLTKPKQKSKETEATQKIKEKKKVNRLREIESKYFGASDDELASDLSDVDSEFERSSGDEQNEADFDEENDDDDSDDAPEEISTVTKSSKKRQLEKSKSAKVELKEPDYSDEESMDDSESENDLDDGLDAFDNLDDSEMSGFDDEESDVEGPPKKLAKKLDKNNEKNDKLNKQKDEASNRPNKKQKNVRFSEDDNRDEENVDDIDDIDDESYDSDQSGDEAEKDEKPDIWEDIYGRKRDKDGNIIKEDTQQTAGKYIPPHLRARMAAEAANGNADADLDPKRKEKLMQLKRLLKGQLNRLSEANMHKIATEIDNLYMRNSRHDMNTTLTALICDALISHVLAPERMVMEHALLIAALHANVGTEVGANLLENLVDRFHQMLNAGIEQYEIEDKTLDNVIFILCHMYTFKIFHHRLIYELLNKLIEKFCEKSVECILLTLRSIGFSLRKDDPAALKELIITIQKKTSEASEELKTNARLKYMLDVLTAVRNNNVNRIPNYDPALAEHLRKILKTLCVNGKYVTTLNISLEDLVNVQNRGKWWVVGSAWTGNINDISGAVKANASKKNEQKFSEQLLELARKQRMNTDERRNVFCILMSAEDYIDAFEKILHLAIKDHRVVVSVIIHCCLSEKTFNPYYAVVAQKFCDYDRKYQLAIQYAVWDRIKDMASHTKCQLTNLAQFLVHLITHAALAISVLKVIEFGELDKVTLRLVRQVLLGILLGKEEICKEVFQRIAPGAQLKPFKDSIRLFMHHFLLKGGAKNGIPEDKMQLLKERIKIADKSLDTATFRF